MREIVNSKNYFFYCKIGMIIGFLFLKVFIYKVSIIDIFLGILMDNMDRFFGFFLNECGRYWIWVIYFKCEVVVYINIYYVNLLKILVI